MASVWRVHEQELIDALAAIEPTAFTGPVWRVVRQGRDPLIGSSAGGRWSPPNIFDVLYTATEAPGALAEIGYRLSLEPIWPSRLNHEIHELSVDMGQTLKLADFDQLKALGVDVGRYPSLDYARTQQVAHAAYFLDFHGLIAPSARYDCANLMIFMDKLRGDASLNAGGSELVNWQTWRTARKLR